MSSTPPARALEPRARPAAAWLGVFVALLLLALAVVAGQAALAGWKVGSVGSSWLGSVLDRVAGPGGVRVGSWSVATGISLVVVGLLLLVVALKPRRRTHVRVESDTELWLSPAALAALARDATEGVRGADRVSVTAGRTGVRVYVTGDRPQELREPVEDAVRSRLDGAQVRVVVRTRRTRSEGAPL